ncbi:MAG: hypothetical protein H7X99_06990 [Saprospiraceae bacterium]|nr:hypothetical protein [Saprospiraceae bacterium]
MSRNQIIVLIGTVVFFLILYFGFEIIPPKNKDLEMSRTLNIESTGISNLIRDAMMKLDADQKNIIDAVNLDMEKVVNDTLKRIEMIKSLSGMWYDYGFPSIAGTYAEDIANLSGTEDSWSMAGTTFTLCVRSTEEKKIKDYCSKRAIRAFENAISIAPENIDHRINLAGCFVDNPSENNPMQGILMLRDLNAKYPDNIPVLQQLARLSLRTNQTDKAIERLEAAIKIDPANQITICLLATAYKNIGNNSKASEYEKKCVN